MPAEATTSPSDGMSTRGLWLLFVVALVLRLFDLARQELWVDEAFTWTFARRLGPSELGAVLRLEPTPPLYYGLIAFLLRWCGDNDLILRLPSALFGAFSVPLAARLGAALGFARVGFAAALLLTFHPWHLFFSREARVYPLLLMLTLGLAIRLRQALQAGTRRAYFDVGALLLLCFYSHLFGLLLGLVAALLILLLAPDRRGRLRGFVAVGGACLAVAPYLYFVLPSLARSGANWSQELFYDAMPEEHGLARIFEGELVGARYHVFQRELARPTTPPLLRWPAIAAQVLCALAALAAGFRGAAAEKRALRFLALFYLLPLLLPWELGIVLGKNILQPGRHDFFLLGPLALLLAFGFEKLRQQRRAFAIALLVPMVLGGGFRLAWIYLQPQKTEATLRGQWIAEHTTAGDVAICFGIERLLAERYTRLAGGELAFESFPAETDQHPGWSDPRPLLRRLPELAAQARERVAALAGQGRILTIERYPQADTAGRLPDWQVDALFIQALQEAGWQSDEQAAPPRDIRIWRSP